MTILFFSRLFYPHIGGVETHVLELSKQLIRKGHKIIVVTEGYSDQLKEHQIYQGIEIYRIPLYEIKEESKKFVVWGWLFSHLFLIKNADVVHIHDVVYWIYPIFWRNKNLFITFHGYEGSGEPTKSAIIQRKIGEALAKKTINIGAFMQKWYRSKPDKILYGATQDLKASKKSKQAVYIGRLHEDTGIMTYLSALKKLKSKNIALNLDVYGDGPQRDQAQEYVFKYKLNVSFKGYTKDARRYLSSYRFAFVSRYLSMLEAMKLKIPVFAVFNNQIKHDYLACHPQAENMIIEEKADKLANHIIKWMRPTQNQQLQLIRAHQWAKNQTWSSMTKQYLDLWQSADK